MPELADKYAEKNVTILLSVFNGERFLPDQLASLLAQTHRSWQLYWRDDGSADRSAALLRVFGSSLEKNRIVEIAGPGGRIGVLRSYFALLAAAPSGATVAFADQDDVWLPEKLSRGLAALATVPEAVPALYCARQMLVDVNLARIGLSPAFTRPPGFPAALAQNIVTGCTAILNWSGASILAKSLPPAETLHDWWSYLVIAAAGGNIVTDSEPALLYRQHGNNLTGAQRSRLKRMVNGLRRGPRPFMSILRQHVASLGATPELLSRDAAQSLAVVAAALGAPPWRRLHALALAGLIRQTSLETALFRLWFLFG